MANSYGLDFEEPILELERKIEELESFSSDKKMDLSGELARLRERCDKLKQEIFSNLSAWQRVQVARHPKRPMTSDYISLMFTDFKELHGDRTFGDDRAIICGLGKLDNEKILFIGQEKGKTTQERLECNFGMAHPEGYRKALRKMKLAEKFSLPVVTFIDTMGAYPGIGAEERGVAWAIAENLFGMARLRTPIVCIIIGEGGSGGALGIGVGDKVSILENSYYSVISPEGCAAILWKSGEKAQEAAEALKLTPKDLLDMGVVDEIIPEPLGGAHRDHTGTAEILKQAVLRHLKELHHSPIDELIASRFEKYRRIGAVTESREGESDGAISELSNSESTNTIATSVAENTVETANPQEKEPPTTG